MTNREIAAKRQGFTAYWQASGKANRTDCRPAEPWGARCASVLLHQAKPLVPTAKPIRSGPWFSESRNANGRPKA